MSPVALALEAVGALAIFMAIAVAGIGRTRSRGAELDARVQRFAEAGAGTVINIPSRSDEGAAGAPSGPLAALRARLGRRAEGAGNAAQRARNANLAEALARADVKLRPAEW
ncbi:MAG TPA: hypothetical protein VMV23_08895, partial [Candidatus Nanopelagicaceae bacterium]|nr:hypothetical protein [Candidatus Nanopelagicaceae bacterium]